MENKSTGFFMERRFEIFLMKREYFPHSFFVKQKD